MLSGQRSFRGAAPSEMAPDGRASPCRACCGAGFDSERLSRLPGRGRAGARFTARREGGDVPRGVGAPAGRVPRARTPGARATAGPPSAGAFSTGSCSGSSPRPATTWRVTSGRSRPATLFWRAGATGRASRRPGELEAWTEELALRRNGGPPAPAAGALGVDSRSLRRSRAKHGPAYGVDRGGLQRPRTRTTATAEDLRAALERLLPVERRRGHTLAGPHRDDLVWTREGQAACRDRLVRAKCTALRRSFAWPSGTPSQGPRASRRFLAPTISTWDFRLPGPTRFCALLPEGAAVILTTASRPRALEAPGSRRLRDASGRRGRARGATRRQRLRTQEHMSTNAYTTDSIKLLEGARGRPQAARHVHRRHRRHLGPAPHGLRARRQLDRRSAGRLRRPRLRSRFTPTTPSRSRTTAAASRSGCTRSTSARRSRSS